MFTTTQNSSRDIFIARMPRMLELEVFELKNDYPDVLESGKYANFRKEYSQWHGDELISRLRILCVNSKRNRHEVIAVYDEFTSQ